jgi:hypothetical protein
MCDVVVWKARLVRVFWLCRSSVIGSQHCGKNRQSQSRHGRLRTVMNVLRASYSDITLASQELDVGLGKQREATDSA